MSEDRRLWSRAKRAVASRLARPAAAAESRGPAAGNGPRVRLAIAAIVKNEGPYLLEWIAFHRVVGVEAFFIADNGSDDGSTELLKGLAAAGIVTHIPFPNPASGPVQLAAYAEIGARYGRDAEWLAFIDADEFLRPKKGRKSILPLLDGMPEDIGAVAVNWAVYGSSFQLAASDGPVLERFTRRAKQSFPPNCHYKSIVRTAALLGAGSNPHAVMLRPGYLYAHADRAPLVGHPAHGGGLSAKAHWGELRLDHFVIKSRAEFELKKVARGRAMGLAAAPRDAEFFAGHDRNEVEDPAAPALLEATKQEMAALRRRIGLA